jgi:hypothetical protein
MVLSELSGVRSSLYSSTVAAAAAAVLCVYFETGVNTACTCYGSKLVPAINSVYSMLRLEL